MAGRLTGLVALAFVAAACGTEEPVFEPAIVIEGVEAELEPEDGGHLECGPRWRGDEGQAPGEDHQAKGRSLNWPATNTY